ncbi:MAG: NifB/NifX family molybdenum-iron cluster-binding protein [Anaerolineae bacterium]
MKIVVSASGGGPGASISPIFGRAPYLVFVETDTMSCESFINPAAAAGGGAGIQAAQFVIGQGAQAVVSANVGPNAFQVFEAAGIAVHSCSSGTVEEAARAFATGRLPTIGSATTGSHSGTSPQAAQHPTSLPAEATVESLEAQAGALRAQIADLQRQLETLE